MSARTSGGDEARLVEAFAAVLSRDGKGTVYGPRNGETRDTCELFEALAIAERTPGRAVFVRVRPEVLALDADDPERAAAALSLVDVMRTHGLQPVILWSRPREEERVHVFVRVVDGKLRRELAEAARRSRIDVREAVRPPLSPHRHGGRSRLVEPRDALEALCRLAPTSTPPAPLRGRDRELLRYGDPEGRRFPRNDAKPGPDRSRLEASVVLRLVQRGYADAAVRSMLLDRANAAGAKARELAARSQQVADRYIAGLCRSARARLRATPATRGHPDVDAACERLIAALAIRAGWRGRGGAALFITIRLLVERARLAGTLRLNVSSRELAEVLGVDQVTAAAHLRTLTALRVLERVSQGGGRWAACWRLIAPAVGEVSGSTDSLTSPTPFGGAVGEVSGSVAPAVGEVRDSESPSPRESAGDWRSPSSLSLTDWLFPDVFGPRGWFGTRGLGHQAAAALVMVEDANGRRVPEAEVRARLGSGAARVLDELCACGLLTRDGSRLRRGAATLEDVARALRTLGTRTWRRARHAHERGRQRADLEERGAARSSAPAAPQAHMASIAQPRSAAAAAARALPPRRALRQVQR